MEIKKIGNKVFDPVIGYSNPTEPNLLCSRSYLPDGVKTRSWEDRMQKTTKDKAIKKLQTELREEKQADIKRYGD
jgi:Cgr1 family